MKKALLLIAFATFFGYAIITNFVELPDMDLLKGIFLSGIGFTALCLAGLYFVVFTDKKKA